MANSTLPQQLFRAQQVREMDTIAIQSGGVSGIQLMKRAGRVTFNCLLEKWPGCERIVVFCGGGNNAGDGYVIAALAAQRHISVQVVAVSDPARLQGDALRAYQYALQEGVVVLDTHWRQESWLSESGVVVVDALLGTGLQGEVRPVYAEVITVINNCGAAIVAVDVPSGLCSESGCILGRAVQADLTVTFIGCKRGLFTAQACTVTGEIVLDDLGVNDSAAAPLLRKVKFDCLRVTTAGIRPALRARPADAHKGMFGHVMVIGGDSGYGGAVALAAEACARSGAGLVSVATQPLHMPSILARLPEVMVNGVPSGQALEPLLKRPSVLVIGPGLGQSPWSEQMLRQAASSQLPMVIDADGLNILAQNRAVAIEPRSHWVYTPHPGEAARLLGCNTAEVQRDRFAAVRKLQSLLGGVVVLKGPGTLIADAHRVYVADVGNPGMASGGMGDVLAGVIGALIAQGVEAIDAACLAVCVHGDAADSAVAQAGQRGLLASDLIPFIRELLNS